MQNFCKLLAQTAMEVIPPDQEHSEQDTRKKKETPCQVESSRAGLATNNTRVSCGRKGYHFSFSLSLPQSKDAGAQSICLLLCPSLPRLRALDGVFHFSCR